MKPKTQISIIIGVLLTIGIGSAVYKHRILGFPYLPVEHESVWTVEAEINYLATRDDTKVSLNLPDNSKSLTVLEVSSVARNHEFSINDERALWEGSNVEGKQRIFLRARISRLKQGETPALPSAEPYMDPFTEAGELAVKEIVEQVEGEKGATEKAIHVLALLNSKDDLNVTTLLEEAEDYGGKLLMACGVLGRSGIPARVVYGLFVSEESKRQNLRSYIEILDEKQVVLLDPRSSEQVSLDNFLLWQEGKESLLEIVGGEKGGVDFSILEGKMSAQRLAVLHGQYTSNFLIDFSIYSLPIVDQNTFKLLLLIPIGALVVVVLRNLVGIPTSGTFMPILLALVFLQTKLLTGLALFLVVVSVGLILRSYLSHLNLLLVPRISAVLVFVIVIYIVVSVTSNKLGFTSGMQVTFFPMIIISWTIERLSVLWEEEGPRDVFKQGGGSLFAASLIYLAMSNRYIEHLTFSFPELLLVVLAVIIMIGSYSGYRLSELRRFEPLSKSVEDR